MTNSAPNGATARQGLDSLREVNENLTVDLQSVSPSGQTEARPEIITVTGVDLNTLPFTLD